MKRSRLKNVKRTQRSKRSRRSKRSTRSVKHKSINSRRKTKRSARSVKRKSINSKRNDRGKSSKKLKLVKIIKSPIKTKKYRAYFNDNSHTDFGAKGYENYGGVGKERHLDENRKKRYIERHKKKEDWTSPKKAGTLSRFVLWNKKTFRESVNDYKRKFKL
jgi:hypothetical protein